MADLSDLLDRARCDGWDFTRDDGATALNVAVAPAAETARIEGDAQ
jgi:hypothetical protein